MNRKILTIGTVLALGLVNIFLISAIGKKSIRGMLVFTQISMEDNIDGNNSVEAWRYPRQSRIVAVNPERPEETLQVLTNRFYSARAPEISFDGKRMFFAGKKQKGDRWQIWEMNLDGLQTRQVTSRLDGCTEPAYLPNGRIVFSAFNSNLPYENEEVEKEVNALYTCDLNGSEVERITFHPQSDFAPAILGDGRILFITSKLDPSATHSKLLAMRYDGMWVESFYENQQNGWQNSRVWEMSEGKLIFVESNKKDSYCGRLIAISNKRPMHSRVDLAPDLQGYFHSAYPLPSGQLFVSYRPPGEDTYALYEFDPIDKCLGKLIFSDSNYHSVEPILALEHPKPKKFVSLVDKQKKTALIYCLDANMSDLPINSSLPFSTRGTKVQVLGQEGVLGEVPFEEDRSFYLEIPTDMPLQFQTINEDGQVVRGPSAWIWARPNEKRGCVGCHEDRELAPENRVPLAIMNPPVSIQSPSSAFAVVNRHKSKKITK